MNADDHLPSRTSWPEAHATSASIHDNATACAGRILVVDDDDGVRDILAEVLRAAGHDVTCAEDGEAAWDALCAECFDVLVTDHEMPRLTGLGLLRRVRAGRRRLPVVMLSGQMPWNEADFPRLLPPGVALEKPFIWAELLATVHDFLVAVTRAGRTHGRMFARRAYP